MNKNNFSPHHTATLCRAPGPPDIGKPVTALAQPTPTHFSRLAAQAD